MVEARASCPALGRASLRAIGSLRGDGPRPAAVLLRGVPYENPGPTPAQAGRPRTGCNVALVTIVATAVGEIVGYRQESDGAMLQETLPTPSDVDRQTSLSSGVVLKMHTEAAFHRHRPDWLALHCFRGDPEAKTLLASVPAAMVDLSLADVTTLSEPLFQTSADESYVGKQDTGCRRLSGLFPVLGGDLDDPFVTFDLDLLVGVTADAKKALENLNAAVAARTVGVTLEQGDVLVVGNRHAVHGRSPFKARFDGTDRWLIRTLLMGQLPPSGVRNGRVIETRYL